MQVLKTENRWYLIHKGEISEIDETVANIYKKRISKRLEIGILYAAEAQRFQNQANEARPTHNMEFWKCLKCNIVESVPIDFKVKPICDLCGSSLYKLDKMFQNYGQHKSVVPDDVVEHKCTCYCDCPACYDCSYK